jgi:hypothetical protein
MILIGGNFKIHQSNFKMVEEKRVAQITFIGHAMSSTLCYIVGLVFPAYASFRAIESPGKADGTLSTQ